MMLVALWGAWRYLRGRRQQKWLDSKWFLRVLVAAAPLGFVGRFIQLDNPTSSARTRELLGWQPVHAGLLADLADRHYFEPGRE